MWSTKSVSPSRASKCGGGYENPELFIFEATAERGFADSGYPGESLGSNDYESIPF